MAHMITAAAIARSGLLASIARLDASASNIARGNTVPAGPETASQPEDAPVAYQPVALAEEAVGLLEASLLFRANLAVLKTADAMTRNMLDTVA
jgi:flagellar basal body rod protein FlgC